MLFKYAKMFYDHYYLTSNYFWICGGLIYILFGNAQIYECILNRLQNSVKLKK